MSTETRSGDYSAKAIEAEAAVASVKDPELRRVAFEKILEHLLESGGASALARKTPRRSKASKRGSKSRASTSKKGPKAQLVELVGEDYFKTQRTIAEVKAELVNRGYHIPLTSLSGPLQALTREKRLKRQKVATKGKGSKSTYAYSTR